MEKPEKAPFFLQAPTTKVSADDYADSSMRSIIKSKNVEGSSLMHSISTRLEALLSAFEAKVARKRRSEEWEGDDEDGRGSEKISYEAVIEYMVTLTADEADFELKALCIGPEDEDGCVLLSKLMHIFTLALESCTQFDLIQAWMRRFCDLYSDVIMATKALKEPLQALLAAQESSWRRMQELLHNSACLVKLHTGEV